MVEEGFEHFDVVPDIMAVGKGMGGGYFPVGAAAVTAKVAETIASNSGLFYAGFTWAGNPLAAAVVVRAITYLREHGLVERAAAMGEYLARRLESLHSHPTVGDIRGLGLLQGIEFVKDTTTRESLDQAIEFHAQLYEESMKRGLYMLFSHGNDRGLAGDMALFAPAYIVTEEQIDEMVELFDDVLTAVEEKNGLS